MNAQKKKRLLAREKASHEFKIKMIRAGYATQAELAIDYGCWKRGCAIDKSWVCQAARGTDLSFRDQLLDFLALHPKR